MNTFAQAQLDRYLDLTQRIEELVPEVAVAEENLSQRKLAAAQERKALDALGDTLVDEAIARVGRVKEFGSNEETRKRNAALVKAQSRRYVQQEKLVEACEADVQSAVDEISDLTRRYSAVCHQVVHHSALLQFLSSAGAGVPQVNLAADIQFERATPNGFVSNGQAITPADAAEIGL